MSLKRVYTVGNIQYWQILSNKEEKLREKNKSNYPLGKADNGYFLIKIFEVTREGKNIKLDEPDYGIFDTNNNTTIIDNFKQIYN